ncbi:hypothetical protein L1987_35763 [Smallanthus sonchifolius]|uniref:Uncharacterized protein n=1 Tax=Smallanthus sonchifolius TaxID=185202 RepID=A0ACB9HBB1_9ASTR|nr:hypothetical protein L1987_35763 [Smallanthus sonchifolius]
MFILARPSSFVIITHTSRLCNKMSNLGRLTTVDKSSEQNTYADIEAAYRCLKVTYGVKEDVILYGNVLITAANRLFLPLMIKFLLIWFYNVGHFRCTSLA